MFSLLLSLTMLGVPAPAACPNNDTIYVTGWAAEAKPQKIIAYSADGDRKGEHDFSAVRFPGYFCWSRDYETIRLGDDDLWVQRKDVAIPHCGTQARRDDSPYVQRGPQGSNGWGSGRPCL